MPSVFATHCFSFESNELEHFPRGNPQIYPQFLWVSAPSCFSSTGCQPNR